MKIDYNSILGQNIDIWSSKDFEVNPMVATGGEDEDDIRDSLLH